MESRVRVMGIAVGALVCALAAPVAPAGDNDLTVRVQDAVGVPGGEVAIVLRSYASKPIGQGQLCLRTTTVAPGGTLALSALQSSQVFSVAGDADVQASAELLVDPQIVVVSFQSLSATVNSVDGPLAVVRAQLSDSVVPGQTFDIEVDLENSSLVDDLGQAVDIRPRPGVLTIRAPEAPIDVGAEAEDTLVGEVALLSFQTREAVLIGLGQVGLRYDPSIAAELPTVDMDARHGQAGFGVSFPEPGLVVVQFQSPDGSLNEVPGDLVEVHLPISPAVPPGTESPVTLDPMRTFLYDTVGLPIQFELGSDVLLIEGRIPGRAAGLRLGKPDGADLPLSWLGDCGTANAFAIYRGDLSIGYDSLELEPGACEVTDTSATVPLGPRRADFFLVVPHANGTEGSFGADSEGDPRLPAIVTCHPPGEVDECAP